MPNQGISGARDAPWHGRRPGVRAFRTLEGSEVRTGGARESRREIQPEESRLAGVSHNHPRVGLDAVAVPRDLPQRSDEAVSRMDDADAFGSDGLPGRQLRVHEYR